MRLFQNDATTLKLLTENPRPAALKGPRFLRLTVFQYRFTSLGAAKWWDRDDGELIGTFRNPIQ